ncbi:tetratricopeptide repeat protein [Aestuariibius sp. 2305UL40-4]|uniref:tetratricopeptide repeat protein n=1 Tax=Aestuariibius violaceus TaxID=3234132 RepID=UPI00345E44C3
MRHSIFVTLSLTGLIAVSGCDRPDSEAEVNRALRDINVIDETNLNDVMLQSSDPGEAVAYFTRASTANPDRIDLARGLAKSLIRAKRPAMAIQAWKRVTEMEEATYDDQVELADAYIRDSKWDEASATLNAIPPTHETYKRYRLEAMVADSQQQWEKADSFYEIAIGLTLKPAPVLNNWGFSKLTRGDARGAERLFAEALREDPGEFTTKNNLVLARAAQRNYDLPVIQMTQIERAQLLYTVALAAIKQGDVATGRGLLKAAIDTHPQHFEAASRSLKALEANVTN